MLLKNVLCSAILLNLLCGNLMANSNIPPRIGSITVDKRQVQKLYIAQGRSSILIFPCNIKTLSTGPTKDISALLNERDSKILEVWLSRSAGQPAGLKVICNEHLFAFDVIPSNITHQDFVNVKGAYGIPTTFSGVQEELKGTVILSSESVNKTSNKISPKVIRIISSSKDRGTK